LHLEELFGNSISDILPFKLVSTVSSPVAYSMAFEASALRQKPFFILFGRVGAVVGFTCATYYYFLLSGRLPLIESVWDGPVYNRSL
jgi:hypothetical protein